MAHVDLHLHLLPGVDDGAPDEAAALEHAARMVAAGVHEATVTPHVGAPAYRLDPLTIAERTAALQRALDREGVALRLHPGGEVFPHVADDLTERELDAIAHGPRGARWVLAEVSFDGIDERFVQGLAALRGRGFGVLIAHPERARGVLSDGGLELLRPELERGCALQVNVCSLLGRQGDEALAAGRLLVRERLAYVLASDGHPGTRLREHTVADGVAAAVAAGASPAYARRLTGAHPGRLLHGFGADDAPGGRDWRGHGALERVRQARRRLARMR